MRRLFVHVVLMLFTFGLGLGVDWLIPKRKVDNVRPVERVEVAAPVPAETLPASPVLPAATPTPYLVFDYDPSRFTPDGVYLINGPTPHEFREFDAFDLSRHEQSSGYVGIQTYSENVYGGQPASFALVTDRRLLFVTSGDQNGIEYRFDGEFVANPKSHIDTNVTVLRGMLTKSRNGRKIAERLFNFRLEWIGC